jgi:hypothetical protein
LDKKFAEGKFEGERAGTIQTNSAMFKYNLSHKNIADFTGLAIKHSASIKFSLCMRYFMDYVSSPLLINASPVRSDPGFFFTAEPLRTAQFFSERFR